VSISIPSRGNGAIGLKEAGKNVLNAVKEKYPHEGAERTKCVIGEQGKKKSAKSMRPYQGECAVEVEK